MAQDPNVLLARAGQANALAGLSCIGCLIWPVIVLVVCYLVVVFSR